MKNMLLDKGDLKDILHGFDHGDIWVEDGDEKDWHILHAAAYFERIDVLEALYERMGEAEFFNLRSPEPFILADIAFLNCTIMHIAMNAPLKIFEWLLNQGGNKPEYLLARDNDGNTALHLLMIYYAHNPNIQEKETECVSKLVDLMSTHGGLDLLDAKQKTGWTALSFLSEQIYIDDRLHLERLNMFTYLVKKGAAIDETDFNKILSAWAARPHFIYCHRLNPDIKEINDLIAENHLLPLIQLPAFQTFHQTIHSEAFDKFIFRCFAFGPAFPEARSASPFLIEAGMVFFIPIPPKIKFTSLYAHPKLNEIFLKTFDFEFTNALLFDPTPENILLLYAKAFLMEVKNLSIGTAQQHDSIQTTMDILNDPVTRGDTTLTTNTIASLREKIAAVQRAKPYFVLSFSSVLTEPFVNFEKLDLALSRLTNHQNQTNRQVQHATIS
jgi:hypothetical protein